MRTDLGNKAVLAKNLNKYMELNNVNRATVSNALGIKYTTFCDWCNGKRYPYIDKIQSLADYFGIDMYELIEDNHYKNKLDYMKKDVIRIPVLSEIPSSFPNEAIDEKYMIDYEEVPSDWANANKEYFALSVKGDSMEPLYSDGDIIIFLKTPYFTSGQDCCIRLDGEKVTIKKLTSKDNGILVSPEKLENNEDFLPKLYTKQEIEDQQLEILGIAKKTIKFL